MFILEFRDNLGKSLSKVIGAPPDQLSLIVTMLSIVPFCFINYLLHGKQIRLLYSLILGFFFQFSIYKLNSIHILISGILTYIFIEFFGRKLSAFYIFTLTMVYLSFLHISRIFFYYGQWRADDPTIIYMMSICKFSSLAFSYEDGGKEESELKNKHHREYRIVEKPTLLEVLSFIYFYPTSIMGPSIEYKDFINFINETDCYTDLSKKFPYIFKYGFLYFAGSFVAMAFYAIVSNKLPIDAVSEKDFGKHSLLYALTYIYFCIPAVRAKYYSGWILSYSTVVFSGLAYTEEKDDKGNTVISLEKGSYGSVVTCEWAVNPKDSMTDWNKTIHLWLKYNVLTRVINIKKKPFHNNWALARFFTFLCSAVWHGYYLTYYLTFFLLFCYQSASVVLEDLGFYKWIYKTKILIPVASIFNGLAFETVGIIFFNLDWERVSTGLKNIRYYPVITLFGLYVITRFIKKPKDKKQKEKEKEKIKENEKNKKVE